MLLSGRGPTILTTEKQRLLLRVCYDANKAALLDGLRSAAHPPREILLHISSVQTVIHLGHDYINIVRAAIVARCPLCSRVLLPALICMRCPQSCFRTGAAEQSHGHSRQCRT